LFFEKHSKTKYTLLPNGPEQLATSTIESCLQKIPTLLHRSSPVLMIVRVGEGRDRARDDLGCMVEVTLSFE